MKIRILVVTWMVFLQTACSVDSSENSTVLPPLPVEEENELTTEELRILNEAGMDASYLERMVKAVFEQDYPNIHSILIVKDRKLVFERYFVGNDQDWGFNLGRVNHSKERLHDIRSITKSVVATCIGIALDQGIIENVDQSIFDFFPDYGQFNTGLRAQITIKDLLTMTSGIQWDETSIPYTDPANAEIQMTNSDDPIEFVLSVPMINMPGEIFEYSGGDTQLLAGIIEKASGMQVDQYAEEFLFSPLGIEDFQWHSYSKSKVPAAASGLRLTSRGLMNFGLLYQNKGAWEGAQILSDSWVGEAFKRQVEKPNQTNGFFGYHFHVHPSFVNTGKTIQHVAAVGNGDQRIFFNEEDDLMVVITAGNYNQWRTKNSLALMRDFIYPSFL